MATPLRHRQTKEAENRYVQPKATAPHLDSTKGRPGQQAGGTAGVPPASEITVRPGTYASCQKATSLACVVSAVTESHVSEAAFTYRLSASADAPNLETQDASRIDHAGCPTIIDPNF